MPSHARRTARVSLHSPNSALANGTARQLSSSKATDLAPSMNAESRCAFRVLSSGSYSRITFISASRVAVSHITLATRATASSRSRSALSATRCRSARPPKFAALHTPPARLKVSFKPSRCTFSSCCNSRMACVALATAASRKLRVVAAAAMDASYASFVALARLISCETWLLCSLGSSLTSVNAATPGTSARVSAAAISAARSTTIGSSLSMAPSSLPTASPSASMPAAVLDVLAVGSTRRAFNVALKLLSRLKRCASRSKMRSSSLSSASGVGNDWPSAATTSALPCFPRGTCTMPPWLSSLSPTPTPSSGSVSPRSGSMLGCSIIASQAHHRFASDSARSSIVAFSERITVVGDPSPPGAGGRPDVDSAPPSACALDCRHPISARVSHRAAPGPHRALPQSAD